MGRHRQDCARSRGWGWSSRWPRPRWSVAGSAAPNAHAVIRVAEFVADCPLSHRLPDDPIVFPGLPGASHSHDFFGNHATDANSDYTAAERRHRQLRPGGGHLVVLGADDATRTTR